MRWLSCLLIGAFAVGAERTEQLWVRKPRSRSAFLVDADALGALCERHGLRLSEMSEVATGKRKHCKGWCCGPIERFVAEPVAAVDDDLTSMQGLFDVPTTVIGRDGIARTAPAPAVEPEPSLLQEEDEDDDDDESAEASRASAMVPAKAAAKAAAQDDEDEDEEASNALVGGAGAGPAGGGGSALLELLRSGQALPMLVSPLMTLALSLAPKSITTRIGLARTLFYCYAVVFFLATALMQNSIAALPDSEDESLGAVRVRVPPNPAQAMQAALAGGQAGEPAGEEAGEELVLSQRAYDAQELGKLRSAVLTGAGLNLVLSFVMKQRGASILLHRALVGLVELATHPLFRAHVLPQTGLLAGHPITRVRRPFASQMSLMEIVSKVSGAGKPLAGIVQDDESAAAALPAAV